MGMRWLLRQMGGWRLYRFMEARAWGGWAGDAGHRCHVTGNRGAHRFRAWSAAALSGAQSGKWAAVCDDRARSDGDRRGSENEEDCGHGADKAGGVAHGGVVA